MTDREKLVELIKGAFDKCCSVQCEGCEYEDEHISARWCQSRMFADFLIANGVTFATDKNVGSKWISVADRLPEESGTYIVVASDGHAKRVTFVKWQKRNKHWELTGARSYWKITHWMPLPEAPEGELCRPKKGGANVND